MSNPTEADLTEEAKKLIRDYMFKIVVPSGIALAIVSGIGGFAINEVARGNAYSQAYSEASGKILDTATQVSRIAGEVEALRTQAQLRTSQAEELLKKALGLQSSLRDLQETQTNEIAAKLASDDQFRIAIATSADPALSKMQQSVNAQLSEVGKQSNLQNDRLLETIRAIGQSLTVLRAQISAIQNASSDTVVRGTSTSVAVDKNSVSGLSGTLSLDTDTASCPPGSFVSAIQGFVKGGDIQQIRFACRTVK
jgi:hypothetical protein